MRELSPSRLCDCIGCPNIGNRQLRGTQNRLVCQGHYEAAEHGVDLPPARYVYQVCFEASGRPLGVQNEGLNTSHLIRGTDFTEAFAWVPEGFYGETLQTLRAKEAQALDVENAQHETGAVLLVHAEYGSTEGPTRQDLARKGPQMTQALYGAFLRTMWREVEAQADPEGLLVMRQLHLASRVERRFQSRPIAYRRPDDTLARRYVEIWPVFKPCIHPRHRLRYDHENMLRDTICQVCDELLAQVKAESDARCFKCGASYVRWAWDDPTGCNKCNRSFVD